MSERSYKLLISDIIDCIEKINRYTENFTFAKFIKNDLTIDAVIRNFEIIGEATSRLPKKFKSTNSSIPWVQMKNFRNLLIHEYFGIDMKMTWTIIQNELPILLSSIKVIYNSLPDSLFDTE